MKHNPPPAKTAAARLALMLLAVTLCILSVSSCATQTRRASSAVQNNVESTKVEPRSLVNINTAGPGDLEKLPGVGKVIAERIIAQREQYGSFRRPEHLMMVRGISDRRFRELRTMIAVE